MISNKLITNKLVKLWSNQEKLDSTMIKYAIYIYPLFGINHYILGEENLFFLLGRFLLAIVFFLRFNFEKINYSTLKNQLIFVFMSYLMFLVFQSNFKADYLIGYFLALFVSTLVMDDPKKVLFFYLFTISFSFLSIISESIEIKPPMIIMVNAVVGLICFILISARKGLQMNLKNSENFYNQLINQQKDAIFVLDQNNKVTFCNQSGFQLFELNSNIDLNSINIFDFINKHLNDKDLKLYERDLYTKGVAGFETEYKTTNGKTFFGYQKEKLLILNEEKHKIVSITDLSQLKTSQEKIKVLLADSESQNKELKSREEKMKILLSEVRAAEVKFRSLNDALTVGVIMTNKDRNCIYANKKILDLLEIDYPDIIGNRMINFVEVGYKIKIENLWTRVLSNTNENQIEEEQIIFNQKISGNKIHTKFNIKAIYNENKIIGYVGTIENITSLIKNEIALKDAYKESIKAKLSAEKALKVRSEFISNMSHEIRTPINAIIGLTDILVQDVKDKDVLENLNTIKYSADNLMVLVNDILDFSKLESGKYTFENIRFDIRNLLSNLIKTVDVKAKEKGLITKLYIPSTLPFYIIGDPHRLNQILLNLASNSVKFTDSGIISLEVNLLEIRDSNAKILFKISDTGIGIPELKLDSIFEEFTQAESSTTRKYGGTGLGLSITKKLVQAQKGNIWVRSKEGCGTDFFVEIEYELPINNEELESQHTQLTENFNLNGAKILLVEDNRINQFVASQILKRWNAEFQIAENGKNAIEFLEKTEFDLVLMDLQMPIMNGFDATTIIRQKHSNVKNHYIPIIALTADVFPEIREKVYAVGMNDFVSKPFEQSDLYHKIIQNLPFKFKTNSTLNLDNLNYMNSNQFQFINLNELLILVDNDSDALQAVLMEFTETTPEDINQLLNAVNSNNLTDIASLSHKIKSSFKHFGMSEAAEHAFSLEKYGKGILDNVDTKTIFNELNQLFEGALKEVNTKLSEME